MAPDELTRISQLRLNPTLTVDLHLGGVVVDASAQPPTQLREQLSQQRAGVDDRISSAALAILRSRGPAAVSVESVAAASGVAKTTIYRRFRNRDALLAAAVGSAATAIPMPSGLSAQDTLRWVLRHARDTIDDVVGRGTVAAVMANADPHFTELLLSMIRTTTKPFREDLRERAIAGEIRRDLDIELVISILLGVVLAEMIRDRPTDDAWVESVLAVLWPAISSPGSSPG